MWRAINDESNRIDTSSAARRALDDQHRELQEDNFIFDTPDDAVTDDEWNDEEYDWEDEDPSADFTSEYDSDPDLPGFHHDDSDFFENAWDDNK